MTFKIKISQLYGSDNANETRFSHGAYLNLISFFTDGITKIFQ